MLCACRGSNYGQRTRPEAGASGGGQFFFTRESCNEIVRALTSLHPESIVDIVARAEELSGDGFSDSGDPSAPFVLARAFQYSGDSRFLEPLAAAARNGKGPCADTTDDQRIVWRAARVISQVYALHLAGNSSHPAWSDLLKTLERQSRSLFQDTKRSGPLASTMAAGAAAMVGMAMPQLSSAEDWREWGLEKLSRMINEYVYPSRPVSLGERFLVAETYLSLIILSERHGIEVPQHVLGGVEQMLDGIAQFPESTSPDRTSELVLNIAPFESEDSREAVLALGGMLFDRPDLCSTARGTPETLLWLTGLDGVEEYSAFCSGESI